MILEKIVYFTKTQYESSKPSAKIRVKKVHLYGETALILNITGKN